MECHHHSQSCWGTALPCASSCWVLWEEDAAVMALAARASTEWALPTLRCHTPPALPGKNIPPAPPGKNTPPDHRAKDIRVLPQPGAESWVQWQDTAKGQPGIPKGKQEWWMAWGAFQNTGLSEEMHHQVSGQQGDTACLGVGLEQGSGEHVWLLECKADVTEQQMGHSFWAGGRQGYGRRHGVLHLLQLIAINKVIMCTN